MNSLDFTRPSHANIEDSKGEKNESNFMTEYPIQISKCTGCMICQNECPVGCIKIIEDSIEPKYNALQGPIFEEESKDEFSLSKYTHARPLKVKTKDPWGIEYAYKPLRRKSATQTWENQ